MPDSPGDLGELVSAKLAEVESLLGPAARAGERVSAALQELRELLDRQREANAALCGLTDFLQIHNEREKASLSRELHDSLGGILTPAKMDLAWLEARLGNDPEFRERMHRLGALIDQGIDLKRRIIEALRPSLLDHLGLASALQWYVEETCRDQKLACHLRISEKLERMPPDLEIAFYRLVQEGLNNVVKHARAKTFDLELERTPEGLRVALGDDGVGIEDLAKAKSLSHGLAGMMHRVRSLGGTFDVASAPGRGTRIQVFVPLRKP
jgi:signal transduction histidine kinase